MPLDASAEDLRLALVAFAAAASERRTVTCRELMDASTEAAGDAPGEVLRALAIGAGARLGAVRVLTTLCGSCGACPRGRPESCGEKATTA